jgi:hypothetical protein
MTMTTDNTRPSPVPLCLPQFHAEWPGIRPKPLHPDTNKEPLEP